MLCPTCGNQVQENAWFCPSCGAPLFTVQTTAEQSTPAVPVVFTAPTAFPAPMASAQDQAQDAYASPAGEDYTKLGGWLLALVVLACVGSVFAIISVLGAIDAWNDIVNQVSAYSDHLSASEISGYQTLASISYVVGYTSIAVSIAEFWWVYLMVKKDARFLRVYQILSITAIVLGIGYVIAFASIAPGLMNSSMYTSSVSSIAGLIIRTVYYCRSKRARVYMGSDEYVQKALFKIG